MNDFFIDMALSVLFAVLKDSPILVKYKRAFQKLYLYIGAALDATNKVEIHEAKNGGIVRP